MKKKILLAVTGSIAVYKSAFLLRLLTKAGHDVKVIMSPSASDFVSPLTFSTLSGHPVYSDVSDGTAWNNHVELGLWADAMLVAPCTANTLAKMASGIADNMILVCYLSAKCPVYFAPAMDRDMWLHPSTTRNIKTLQSYGNKMIDVGYGELASGLEGYGRMAEPEDILDQLESEWRIQQDLAGKKVVITAGPTREPLDPVRYIGNRSSGKMGNRIADECAARGAEVTIVLGPTTDKPRNTEVNVIGVKTAEQMYQAAVSAFASADIGIMAAAVSDYTPEFSAPQKIKKQGPTLALTLKKTKDIAESLGKSKKSQQILIGFALETDNELTNAQKKLAKKNLDFVVLNSLRDKGAGFQHDTNKITIVKATGDPIAFPLKSKTKVAEDIVNEIVKIIN